MSSSRKARQMASITIPLIILVALLVFSTGLIMFGHYLHCDPLKTKAVKHGDQLVIYFVVDTFRDIPGLPGLFLACLFR